MRWLFPPLLMLLTSASTPERSSEISAVAVPLDPAAAEVRAVGSLRWLGGWELRSQDPRFGGLSAMVPVPGGLLAVSDAGGVFRIRTGGVPSGQVMGVLPAGPGPGSRKSDRDAESLTRDPASGRLWVGFEFSNQLWRYAPDLRRAEAHRAPAAMHDWPENGGAEAMVRLPDGRFLLFAEDAQVKGGGTELLLFPTDPSEPGPQPIRMAYRAPEGFSVTDATLLPGGRLLVLQRRASLASGVAAVLSLLPIEQVERGGVLAGRPIATLASPLTVDNMEALATTREGGRTIVWIASDDNFSALQRTLLLKFWLPD